MPASDPTLTVRAGDRHGDLRVVVRGAVKPPVLSRRAIRGLCLACLTAVAYGTLGPLGTVGPWVVPVEHWQLVPPYVPTNLDDLLTNFAVYVPVGIAFRLLMRRRGQAGSADLVLGFALSAALSYVTEVLQQALPGRVASMTDVCVDAVAALTGCLCAVPVQRGLRQMHSLVFVRLQSRRWRRAIIVVIAAITIATVATMPTAELDSALGWVPFKAQFQASFRVMLADILLPFATYTLLALLCVLVARDRGPAIALLLLAGLVGGTECLRVLAGGHFAGTTPALLALIAWVLTARIWRSLRPQVLQPPRS